VFGGSRGPPLGLDSGLISCRLPLALEVLSYNLSPGVVWGRFLEVVGRPPRWRWLRYGILVCSSLALRRGTYEVDWTIQYLHEQAVGQPLSPNTTKNTTGQENMTAPKIQPQGRNNCSQGPVDPGRTQLLPRPRRTQTVPLTVYTWFTTATHTHYSPTTHLVLMGELCMFSSSSSGERQRGLPLERSHLLCLLNTSSLWRGDGGEGVHVWRWNVSVGSLKTAHKHYSLQCNV